jgi:cytochrome c oxidase subunit 2
MKTLSLFFLVPAAVGRLGGEIDNLLIFITAIAVFFFVLTQGLLIYFVVRYRQSHRSQPAQGIPYITGNLALETVWTVVPSLVLLAVFGYGYWVFRDIIIPRPQSTEINVVASQWLYEFKYPDGKTALNELRVPLNQPTKLIMTSKDVIHGFYLPDFRLKQDILPGRYTSLWFQPDQVGEYIIFCTQYCGTGHSKMNAKLMVMAPADFQKWEAGGAEKAAAGMPLAERGKELAEKSGCLACHTTTGAPLVGPTWKGLYGSTVTLADDKTAAADENYLEESIVDPGAKIVKGFPNLMPAYKQSLSRDDILAIIAYLKTLK